MIVHWSQSYILSHKSLGKIDLVTLPFDFPISMHKTDSYICLVYFKLYSSRLGRVWECIGKTEDLLANTGISVFVQKQIVFSVSCFFAGLAGALYAPYIMIVTPSEFSLWQGITIVLGVLVGGIYSPLGAIIGTVFMAVLNLVFTYLPIQTQQINRWFLVLSLCLGSLFMPTGIFGLSGIIRNKIKELTGNKKVVPTVYDKENKTAIPFATIGIVEENIGTVTNNDGFFTIKIPASLIGTSLVVSHLGYMS